MRKIVLRSLFALVFFVACSEDSSNKPKVVNETSSTVIRRSIPKDADVKPSTEARAKKRSRFIYARTTCNIRRGPGTRYSIVRKATKGEKLEYSALEGHWYKLKGGKGKPQQWVHKSVVIPTEQSQH